MEEQPLGHHHIHHKKPNDSFPFPPHFLQHARRNIHHKDKNNSFRFATHSFITCTTSLTFNSSKCTHSTTYGKNNFKKQTPCLVIRYSSAILFLLSTEASSQVTCAVGVSWLAKTPPAAPVRVQQTPLRSPHSKSRKQSPLLFSPIHALTPTR